MNDNFGFLLGMYSIIAGLGVSRLLEGVNTLFRRDRARQLDWLHGAVIVFGLLVQVTTWLSLWSLRHVDAWDVWRFLFVLMVPVLLFLFSGLVLPDDDRDDASGLRTYYTANARWMHGLLAAALLANTLSEYVLLARFPMPALTISRVFLIVALSLCAIWPRSLALHRVLVPFVLVAGALMPAWLDLRISE